MGCVAICDVLYNSGLVVDLNLSDNLFGDKEAVLIAETIKVTGLSLSVNANINFNIALTEQLPYHKRRTRRQAPRNGLLNSIIWAFGVIPNAI